MSNPSGAPELEGVIEDLEGEAEMTDWSESREKKPVKLHDSSRRHSAKLSSGKEKLEKVRSRSALTGDEKFKSAKQDRSLTTRPANRSRSNISSSRGTQGRNPHLSTGKLSPKTQSEDSKNKTPSDVGDIAGVIGILDSSRKKTVQMISKAHKPDDKKTDLDVKVPSNSADLSTATVRKRKLSSNEDADSSKSKRINEESDGKDKSSKEEEEDKIGVIALQQESEIDMERKLPCSEEDSRSIDSELVEDMMGSVKQNVMPKYGDKYTVKFSPVELADLADETLQKLVISQPNMVFYFKRQGKFKKKKGYAEVYLSQIHEARTFLQKLLQIKLVENRMDVTITVSKPKKDDEVLSLVVWLNKNGQLLKLVKSTEDATKVLPAKKEQFKLEKVPASANALILRTLFPYAAEVIFSAEKKKLESVYRGPVTVHYTSVLWLEAMFDCCSDFTYNGYTLSVQYTRKKPETKTKPASDIKKDAGGVLEKRNSAQDKIKQGDSTKTVKDGNSSSVSHRSEAAAIVSIPHDSNFDDDISHMTLDVCTGMMESLSKLRQLGTDNPSVLKILQMQNELATLQQSLSQSKDQSHNTSKDSQADPWTVSATEDLDDKQDGSEKGQDKKLSKEPKKKQDKETRADKQRKEMEDLQRMFEEADEAKRQSEEKVKRQLEIELQKMKELEEKRKSTWARKMIEDAKQSSPQISGESASSKEEVQRLLKIVGNKRKEAEDAKKLEEEAKEREKEKLQAASTMIGQDEALKQDTPQFASEVHDLSDDTVAKQGSSAAKKDGEDGLDGKSATSNIMVEHHTLDTITEAKAWSPDRNLHAGTPVYSEEEFNQICSENAGGTLPWNYYIQVTYYANRRCPVNMCPATKYFKTAASFALHWDVFHKPDVTMKFCQKCSAYFTNASELETHLTKNHSISNPQTVKKMSEEAREKIVSNPSFRDPGRYLPPVV